MRYKPGHREETRKRIVQEAASAFRDGGAASVSIQDIMKRLGITHGGFYAHFASKEALLAEACSESFRHTVDMQLERARVTGQGLIAVVEDYLSDEHRDNPASGCVAPALAAEIGREGMTVRYAFTRSFEDGMKALAGLLPTGTEEQRMEVVLGVFSVMVGAITLSRTVCNPPLSDRILEAARQACKTLLTADQKTSSQPRQRLHKA